MHRLFSALVLTSVFAIVVAVNAQTMPDTAGVTLSGHHIVLAQTVKGHPAMLAACFSKDAGPSCGEWAKQAQADPALAGVAVYELAMLGRAPGFIRGTIESGMRKGLSVPQQDRFVVLTQDEPQWRSYLGVTTDKDAWVVLIDPAGKVLWHGHGNAGNLEPLLKSALK
jgi:hypothetical protein